MSKANKNIKVDSHGFYIRMNGQVYRPEESTFATGYNLNLYKHLDNYRQGTYRENQSVVPRVMTHTPCLKIELPDNKFDVWFSHGLYLGYQNSKFSLMKPDEIWTPVIRAELKLVSG